MCRNLINVNPKTLPELLERMNRGNKCLIINTAPSPKNFSNPLQNFGVCGYDLTIPESKKIAKETLNGLMSIPENCGKILCEIV